MHLNNYTKLNKLKFAFTLMTLFVIIGCSSDSNEEELNDMPFRSGAEVKNKTNNNSCSNSQLAENTLNILYSDPPTLDPHIAQDSTSASIILELYSGLVSLDTDLKITPDLAESWEISEDGMKYTFTIRDNIRFHNGKKMTASDIIWSFNRAADPKTASITAKDYLGDIIGVSDVINGKAKTISGIKQIDERTIEINIDSQRLIFLQNLLTQ